MIGLRLTTVAGAEVELGVTDGRFAEPDGVTEWIDARHLTATSGLVDAHGHLEANSIDSMATGVDADPVRNAADQIGGGVLVVGDKGTRTNASFALFDRPPDTRPEIHTAGRVIASPGGYYPDFAIEVAGADLPEAVEAACTGHATWVKLIGDWPRRGRGAIPNYVESELRAAVDVAHAKGRRVAIHTAAPDTPSMAVAAGVDSIEHGLFLTEDDVIALGARAGAWVPTLAAMRGLGAQLGVDSSGGRLLGTGVANAESLLGTAVDRGVAVLAGTDLFLPHGAVATEVIALSTAGLGAAAALAAATSTAYGYFGSERALGPGFGADVVAFEGNPTEDIQHLTRPSLIVRAGRIVRRP